jgi:hypothetical protein
VTKHECLEENAPRFLEWIKKRGGVSIWKSISLSDPSYSMSTPARDLDGTPTPKPHWRVDNAPARTVTSTDDIEVFVPREVKRFHVAVRPSGNGLSVKVTDGGTRRIRREVDKAGEDAYYAFDYGDYQNAVIFVPDGKISLTEWAEKHQEVTP